MGVKQEGLEKRVAFEARRISSQHRQLEAFHELVAQALAAGEPAGVLRAFMRFRDALEAHFAMEDEVFFPALHGLRPDLEAELTVLVQEHRGFRTQLERVQALFDAEQIGEGGRLLEDMVGVLIEHETREERLQAGMRR